MSKAGSKVSFEDTRNTFEVIFGDFDGDEQRFLNEIEAFAFVYDDMSEEELDQVIIYGEDQMSEWQYEIFVTALTKLRAKLFR